MAEVARLVDAEAPNLSDHRLGQPLPAIAAAMVFGSLVFLSIATAPILLGALVEAGRLSNATLGLVATLELLGIAVGATVGPPWLRAGRAPAKLGLTCLALVGLNWACTRAETPAVMASLRLVSGLFEGLVLAGANLIMVYTRRPEGMNGYFLGITTIPQIAATYLLSSSAIPRFGPNIGFQLMAAASLLGAVAALATTRIRVPPLVRGTHRPGRVAPLAAAALLTILLQNAAVGAGYSYLVQFAIQDGVPDQVVGVAMAGLQLTAVIGSLAVGFVAWRFSQAITLTLGCALQAGVTLAIIHVGGSAAYIVLAGLFGLCWNALLPFSLKLLIELDETRGLALLNGPVSLAGLGVGPIVVSAFVTKTDVAPAFEAAAAIFAASSLLYLAVNLARRARRPG